MRIPSLVSTRRRATRRHGTMALAGALTVAAGMASLSAAAPALAQGAVPAAAPQGGTGGPPPPGGGSYAHTVYSKISINGSAPGSGSVQTSQYVGPPCWLEPRFTGAQSWVKGDPQQPYTDSFDADTYWWWFATLEPGFPGGSLAHAPGGHKLVNDSFRKVQGQPGWWWVPSWLDGPTGLGCALGLVGSLNLNNGFLQLAQPQNRNSSTPGQIDGKILARMARAALTLPTISVITSPRAPQHPSDVNLPTWVAVTYHGNKEPSDTASVPTPGGTLSATVTATKPEVSLSVSAPAGQARLYNHCGSTGSRYNGGDPTAIPACGVTFLAPSTSGPYTLTVTVRWTVTWNDSQGHSGTFHTPPASRTSLTLVTVREIQSINSNGNH